MANVETMENSFPLRYLFRRRLVDSGGPGRYRGGTGMELALVPHDAPERGLHYVISGKGHKYSMSEGLSGGYPGAPNRYVWVHDDAAETGRNLDPSFAQSLEEMSGSKEEISWGVYPLLDRDVLYVAWNGGGGYGDPLAREPAALQADVENGVVSRQAAREVYGVVLDENRNLDVAATASLRRTLVNERAGGVAAE
jgi:N-methylhydantoinase B